MELECRSGCVRLLQGLRHALRLPTRGRLVCCHAVSLNPASHHIWPVPVAHNGLCLAAIAGDVQVLDVPQRAVVPQRLARRRKWVVLCCRHGPG